MQSKSHDTLNIQTAVPRKSKTTNIMYWISTGIY
jgi:hypothetical protein